MKYDEMFQRLMPVIGNAYGVCAAMGGIHAESAGKANNVQGSYEKKLGMGDETYTKAVDDGTYTKFVTDSVGYGYCQWTSSGRKKNLLEFARARGVSIGDELMQLDFMIHELRTSYKAVFKVLQTATSVKEASDYFTKKFERPANQSEAALARRSGYGEEFYREFVAEKEKEQTIMIKPVDYKQTDGKWGTLPYATNGEKSTIKSSGCGPTTMADVLASIVSPFIDPVTCASWALQNGYKAYNNGTYYSYFVPQAAAYGVTVKQLNTSSVYGKPTHEVHTKALTALMNGNWLIACMGKGNWTKSGHFVLAYGFENGMVYINDPASTKKNRACNTWELFKSQVKTYWVVEVPEHIKKYGIVANGEYRQKDFVREVQLCIGAGLDGVAGKETIGKTVTVSKKKNRKHNVVLMIQKKLKKLGLYNDKLDKVAGNNFDAALKAYQTWMEEPDGEATAKGTTWKKLLGLMK